jgi:PKD repeat protein
MLHVGVVLVVVALVGLAGAWSAATAAAAQDPVADCTLSATEIEPGESVTLNASGSENATAYRYDATGNGEFGSWTDRSSRTFTYEEAGTYEPQVQVQSSDETTDTAGCGTLTVEPPNDPPTAGFSYSPSDPEPGETVSLVSESSDSDGEVVAHQWAVNGEVVGEQDSLDYAFEDPGEYFVNLTVTDDDDARNSTERTVTVEAANEPPTVDVSANATTVDAGESVTFTADAADPDGEVVAYEWRVDGTVVREGPSLARTFDGPGDHEVSVTVTDGDGATATADVVITVAAPDGQNQTTEEPPDGPVQLTARWGHTPRDPGAGQQVTLFGVGPVDPRLSYRWDVDDDGDTEIEGRFVGHTFRSPGRYPVTLTVTGPDGTERTETRTIVVGDPQLGDGGDGLSVWMTPTTPRLGQRVSLFANAGGDIQVETYRWDLDGDGSYEAEGRGVTHAFQQDGTEVNIQVVGADGQTAETSMDVRTAGEPVGSNASGPSLWISPVDPQPNQRTTLMAEAAVPSGEVDAYRWDLDGDGEDDEEGRTATTSFSEDGQYAVGLTVERANGSTATVERFVVVGNATFDPPQEDEEEEEQDATTLPVEMGVLAAMVVLVIVLAGLFVGWRVTR